MNCNIPLHKLEHKSCQNFLKTYCKIKDKPAQIPSSSTLRKKYVSACYKDVMTSIKNQLKAEYLWISVDETTDTKGRQIANLIVGVLNDSGDFKNSYLISVKCLEKTNYATIARFVNESLTNFFYLIKYHLKKYY